jgi:hypothetical protein
LDFCRQDPILLEEIKKFPKGNKALIICDQHWSHTDENTVSILSTLNCDYTYITAGATDLFSALDVGINKSIKSYFRNCFEDYCSKAISAQLKTGIAPSNIKVNFQLSTLKPIAGKWMIECYKHLKEKESLIPQAWKGVETNLEKALKVNLDLSPVELSTYKIMDKYLTSLKPQSISTTTNKEDTDDEQEEHNTNKETNGEEDPQEESEREDTPVEEDIPSSTNSNKGDNAQKTRKSKSKKKEIPLGSEVEVLWDDADGHRWEKGTVKERKSGTRYSYIISYEFLKSAGEDDPDVEEKCFGKEKAKWRYVKL